LTADALRTNAADATRRRHRHRIHRDLGAGGDAKVMRLDPSNDAMTLITAMAWTLGWS
jgi:hypothetical protein